MMRDRAGRLPNRNRELGSQGDWGLGLPAAVEEALVNGLPQADALRLRLVSRHWAKVVAHERRELTVSLLDATLPRRRRWQRCWPERVSSRFSGLRSLCVHLTRADWERVDKQVMFRALSTLPFLHGLIWHDCDILSADLRLVCQLTALRHLDLLQTCGTVEHHSVSERVQCVQPLLALTDLQSLSLQRFSFVPDYELASLSALTALTALNVCECAVNDHVLQQLASTLTRLQSLDITWPTQLSTSGLEHLTSLASLTELAVGGCYGLEASWMKVLSRMPSLTKLHLHELDIDDAIEGEPPSTDTQLANLGALPSLNFIDLSCNLGLSDTGLASLSQLTSLRDLDLACSFASDANCHLKGHGLSQLGPVLAGLHRIDLSRCMQVTDEGLAGLACASSLRWLLLNHCSQLSDLALQPLRHLHRLRVLGLADLHLITADGVRGLPLELTVLNLAGCVTTMAAPSLGTALARFSSLRELHFGWNRCTAPHQPALLAPSQPEPPDAVLCAALAGLTSVETIHLHHAEDISLEGVCSAIAALPNLSAIVLHSWSLANHFPPPAIFSAQDCLAIQDSHPNRPRLSVDTRCCSVSSDYNHIK